MAQATRCCIRTLVIAISMRVTGHGVASGEKRRNCCTNHASSAPPSIIVVKCDTVKWILPLTSLSALTSMHSAALNLPSFTIALKYPGPPFLPAPPCHKRQHGAADQSFRHPSAHTVVPSGLLQPTCAPASSNTSSDHNKQCPAGHREAIHKRDG